MQQSRSQKKKTSRKVRSEDANVSRMYRELHGEKIIYRRWMSGTVTTVSTGAGGVVALTTLANAASAQASPDFSSLAALYTAYRVRAIRVEVFPILTAPGWNGASLAIRPAVIACFPWTSNTVPTTYQQALDVTGLKLVSGYSRGVIQTSYKGDPDAHLWTGTGSAIGSSEQFGISCIGTSTTAENNATVWNVVPQYLVEFRMTG